MKTKEVVYALIISGVVTSVLLSFFLSSYEPITNGKAFSLTQNRYDIELTKAPIATGFLLEIISYIFTKSKLGPTVVRSLLKDNKVVNIRELAAQIELPPMYFPMRRLTREEHSAYYKEAVSPSSLQAAVTAGLTLDAPASSDGLVQESQPLRTIEDYARYYKAGNKPSDLIKRTLATIYEWESKGYKIFSEVQPEVVLRQAFESDARHAAGETLSIFDGVPIAFKDNMEIVGHHVYYGQNPNPAFAEFYKTSTRDDTMIARFRAAGAIILGLTIMVEGGVTPYGYNAHFKGPISTFSNNRYTGGSSSGSAAAVMSGLVPVAIGYDGGGSVRLPSSMSGLHGLATSFARVPFEVNLDSTLIKGGPMATTTVDAALTYALIAPNEPGHFYSELYDGGVTGLPQPHLAKFHDISDLTGVRIGLYEEMFNDSLPHIRDRAYEVVRFLQEKGAEIVPITIPHLQSLRMAHGLKIGAEFALGFDGAFHAHPSGLEPGTRITVAIGSTVTALESLAGEKLRAFGFKYMAKLFAQERLSAIISPTLGIDVPIASEAAKLVGESNTGLALQCTKNVFLANFLGLPGYTVPVGYLPPSKYYPGENTESLRLPIGVQLLGDHWADHKLLRIAHAIEKGLEGKFIAQERAQAHRNFYFDPFSTSK